MKNSQTADESREFNVMWNHQTTHQLHKMPSFHAVFVFTHLKGSLAIGKSKVIWPTLLWLYSTAEKITLICHRATGWKVLSTERKYWRQKCYILQDFRGRSISLKVHLLLDYRHRSTTIIHSTVTPPYSFLAIKYYHKSIDTKSDIIFGQTTHPHGFHYEATKPHMA